MASINSLSVRVIVPVRAGDDSCLFDYIVPNSIKPLVPGALVVVPFRNQVITACIVEVLQGQGKATREIMQVLDERLWPPNDIADLAGWIAREYACPVGVAFRACLMGGLSLRSSSTYELEHDPSSLKTQRQVARILGKGWRDSLKRMLDLGIIRRHSVYTPLLAGKGRDEVAVTLGKDAERWVHSGPISLTPEQEHAVGDLARGGKHLLFGITGSGKTEVYMQIVERRLNNGEGAIVLIPEISLTPQTVARFRARFGKDVALLHSGLSQREKYTEWKRLRDGEARVAVGARSAVFAPVRNLGQIIIDEEHDSAYKQDDDPKYRAAGVSARRTGNVILGSATPSVESYHCARKGEYNLVYMRNRVSGMIVPTCRVVDMRAELAAGNRTIFSRELYDALDDTIRQGQQAILFLNRRGHSTFVLCRECGYVVRCPWCDVSAVYHQSSNRLMCHYCSWSQKTPETCPSCGSVHIRYFGTGTERVETEVKARFPNASVSRMDRDTTRRRGAFDKILSEFREGAKNVLVGTQMVSKGHDIPGVTLVGIISADITLNLPDFRSAERTYQLLSQASGRAGRSKSGGRVVVQTYSPEHYAVSCAASGDYERFYESEISVRQELGYPPFGSLLSVAIRGKSAEECLELGRKVVSCLSASCISKDIEVLGPAPQAVSRIKRVHRWQVLVKAPEPWLAREAAQILRRDVSTSLSLDLNPENVI